MRNEEVAAIDVAALISRLLASDSESDVIRILSELGLWQDDSVWRYYGDTPGNYANAGNQQSNPEAALVEKLTNSIDACLMLQCQLAQIDPRSDHAPRSIREAVAMFFEGATRGQIRDYQGILAEWQDDQVLSIARQITLATTGPRAQEGDPLSISIADAGEGQAPEDLPDTILSIDRQLKQRIPFVQGKWNMGGTGALRFAGARGLQLVLSRRHPELAAREAKGTQWGVTIVRRDDPTADRRVSALRYLAPTGSQDNPNHGDVLRIAVPALPIFPRGQVPYGREAEWGTLIKLYEYATRFRTHMFRRSGLLERLDLLLPGAALPVRLHECREYRGSAGSFETTLTGLGTRLVRSTNLEPGFPDSGQITIRGERVPFTIYAFQRHATDTYRRGEGVLFVVNGQTHATLPDRFFRRQDVGMGLLRRSLLVFLDCGELSDRTHEVLFMNSRDRLADSPIARQLQDELAYVLFHHDGLRALRERRRQEEIEAQLGDSRPVEEVLKSLIKRQPSLSALFLPGEHASNPFSTMHTPVASTFRGKPHPTEFHFKGHPYGYVLERASHIGDRTRITLETDVENGYFTRPANRGRLRVDAERSGAPLVLDSTVNLRDGYAHVNIVLPEEVAVADRIDLEIIVDDPTLVEPFRNKAQLTVRPAQQTPPGPPRPVRPRPEPVPEGNKECRPAGIALPEITEVYRDKWNDYEMTKESGLRVEQVDETPDGVPVYGFFVNMDNQFLQAELKATRDHPEVVRARFRFALVLGGLGAIRLLQQQRRDDKENGTEPASALETEDAVALVSDALVPIVLPMIASLGTLAVEDLTESWQEDSGPE